MVGLPQEKKALGDVWRQEKTATVEELRDGLEDYYTLQESIDATTRAPKVRADRQRRQGQWNDGYQAMGAASKDGGRGRGDKGKGKGKANAKGKGKVKGYHRDTTGIP